MRNRVLVLSNTITGLYCFRKEVLKSIVEAGYEMIISIPDADNSMAVFFKGIGCRVIGTSFSRRGTNPLSDFNLMLKYGKLIKQFRPRVVLTYTIKPNVYGGMAARYCGVPLIANVTGLGDAVENGGWMQKLTIVLYKLGINKARRVFFQNEGNRNFCIRKGIANSSSILLPGSGVNLQYHSFQKYPEDNGTNRFLFIGRMLKDKGINELFETAKKIKAKFPHTEFQFVGSIDGDYKEQVDELTKAGVIQFFGSQSDVRPFIGAVHCTIMPSYHEGMSNVNLESAANGRPVITTNVPGCMETVEDGKTGFLVEAKNTNSLFDAVERFIVLPYSQKAMMGIEGRKKMEREFDRNIVIDAYLKEIKKISNV